MIEKIEGLIIGKTTYQENSLIIQVITKKYGLISFLARGAKKYNNKLYPANHTFSHMFFYTKYKKNKLNTLHDIDILNQFSHIVKDIKLISYTSYLISIYKQIISDKPNGQLFDNLIQTIYKINENYHPQVLIQINLVLLLEYLGISPVLDRCVKCGSQNDIVTISLSDSGVVCRKCLANELICDLKIIKLLMMFKDIKIKDITEIKLSENVIDSLAKFLETYYQEYSGLYLNQNKYFQVLKDVEKEELV